MLDLDRLITPPEHGDVLIEPPAERWPAIIAHNRATLNRIRHRLLDSDFTAVRRRTRAQLGAAADQPLILIGHQPEFFHAGVWAKHVLADAVARRLGGRCVNLVVDNDAPKNPFLRIPVERDGEIALRNLRYATFPAGVAFESIPAAERAALEAFERELRAALDNRFARSMMPAFVDGMRRAGGGAPRDWVEQSIAGRRAVEAHFDVRPEDVRVSRVWGGPLLFDMLADARRFATAYNAALDEYRQARRIRDRQRPIPDLTLDEQRCELPIWAYRLGQVRRRLFVQHAGQELILLAEQEPIARLPRARLRTVVDAEQALSELAGFCLRPRALTLTLWARLLAADLFVHGIGGAKYDLITDGLMRRYYGVEPPEIACVSATLRLDLPVPAVDESDLRRARYRLRDLRWNPQRHLHGDGPLRDWAGARQQAVDEAERLRARAADQRERRRAVFNRIREINARMLAHCPGELQAAQRTVDEIQAACRTAALARDREFLFALLAPDALHLLVERLSYGARNLGLKDPEDLRRA